jgi:hypothetical protein
VRLLGNLLGFVPVHCRKLHDCQWVNYQLETPTATPEMIDSDGSPSPALRRPYSAFSTFGTSG